MKMFGVVLWCSENGEKAVIWCEDHGDLAFFHDVNNRQVLEAGDMVRFRAENARKMRLARDLVLVAQDGFRGLPERLRAAGRPGRAVVRRITPAA
ncbi:hypothetical protein SAMN05216196_10810 [Lutimaribacter pacificus]|uniref:Cold shock protein, CspA family n=1 Tax=Lutimaribacter pacificus TaxID=391948 RepID=A0A1H0LIG7_9RHOB|nr:hypothetical protein [Lutimaribacter pacificus]SDO67855.1 hypothetical protein SAMN05216196_10810 [Lutimaribacter pacificus]SHK06832.1 hypothetical protein SAMN05444142_103147 [Lutimaribacter pacificus]